MTAAAQTSTQPKYGGAFFRDADRKLATAKRRWRTRIRLWPLIHGLWFATRWIGMRDRLRCPTCRIVGTWKPYGTRRMQQLGDRPARRWLCKCCGYYEGPEGAAICFPDPKTRVWRLPRRLDRTSPPRQPTPFQLLIKHDIWPWAGS